MQLRSGNKPLQRGNTILQTGDDLLQARQTLLLMTPYCQALLLLPMQATQVTAQTKACKRVCLPNHTRTRQPLTERRAATNTGLAKVAVQCSADTFVFNRSLVLRINICGGNRHLRQARNRYSVY